MRRARAMAKGERQKGRAKEMGVWSGEWEGKGKEGKRKSGKNGARGKAKKGKK
jgi:hypothetical protein